MSRLGIVGQLQGLVFGLKLGALIWGAFLLGLASISTADFGLLIGWFAGQSVELAIGGAVVGSAMAGERLTRLSVKVILFDLLLLATTVIPQSLGLAPTVRM